MQTNTTNFRVGQNVVFGRPNGEQTHGVVIKVNGKTLKIEQTEVRGQVRERKVGTVWRVAASFVRAADPLQVPVAVAKPVRSMEAIMADMQRVESALSPENLFWDGERPRSQAKAAERVLTRRLAELESELARA
jgi:hypothetical protein